MNRVLPRFCSLFTSFLCLMIVSVAIVAQEKPPAKQPVKPPASQVPQKPATQVPPPASTSTTTVPPAPAADPTNSAPSESASTAEPETVYKGTLANSFALEPRIGGVIWQGQSYSSTQTGDTPNVNGIRGSYLFNGPTIPTIGFGVRINLDVNWCFAPSLDFTFDEYVYRSDLGLAFPTQNSTGNAVGPVALVMGIMVNLPLWYNIQITKQLTVGVAPGLVIYPKIAVSAIDNSSGIDAIGTFLNKEVRWLYPQTAASLRYAINPWLSAALEIQVLYPIWHIWASDQTPFYDTMMINTHFAFDFYL